LFYLTTMYFYPPSLLLLAFLLSANCFAIDNDDDVKAAPSAASQPAKDLGQHAGIRTQALQKAMQQPEISVQGTVVDPEPLLKLRQQYLAAKAEQSSAQARYQATEQNLARTRNLHQQDIVSTRRLQEQQAQRQSDQALLAASNYQQQMLLESARLQWGEHVTEWFTQANNNQAQQLLTHQLQLLQVSFPPTLNLPASTKTIWVDGQGRRDHAVKAEYISSLPQVDPITQGSRYLFRLAGHSLPFGARITAWIPAQAQQSEGVAIPESAVVWHLGQAYVFIEDQPGQFEQRAIPELLPNDGGYFAATGFKPGESIVVTGAQTLLSKKLEGLIPDEDDD
jgi:hypothetical protein